MGNLEVQEFQTDWLIWNKSAVLSQGTEGEPSRVCRL
jgi:hypothetical protein